MALSEKPEARNPKSEGMTDTEQRLFYAGLGIAAEIVFAISMFEIPSGFEFRISSFSAASLMVPKRNLGSSQSSLRSVEARFW